MDPLSLTLLIAGYAVMLSLPFVSLLADNSDRSRHRSSMALASLKPAFKTAAGQLGLHCTRPRERGARMEGAIDDAQVTAQCVERGAGRWWTTITVQSLMPRDFSLQTRWRARAARDGALDSSAAAVDTGDPAFDALIVVTGRAAAARACLTSEVRQTFVTLARSGVLHMRDGELAYDTAERIWAPQGIVGLVRSVLDASRGLPRLGDVAAALAKAARNDPLPAVRERCLATLLSEEPHLADLESVLDGALRDPSAAVRIVAALALGERGVPVLREIATSHDSEEADAARAVAVLGRRLTVDETLAILDAAVGEKREIVASAAVETLGHSTDPRACRRLRALLARGDDALALDAARALGTLPSAAAEHALTSALLTSPRALRLAIVRSLGRVGGLSAMTALRTFSQEEDLDSALASTIEQAVASIQARLPGAAAGQISLAEDASGELSLTEPDARGRVSLSHKPGSAA